MLVYDSLRRREGLFRVAMDSDRRILLSVKPVASSGVPVEGLPERAGSYADALRREIQEAVKEAERRYRLLRDLDRIQEALSSGDSGSPIADIVPSVW
ncbi:TPA: hypothetical protein EYP13_04385 [Candidatus Micrarchaeota archaeon]|nr:hypothetical protein [Candidatus Micrarchaeota archaeon]